MHPLLRVTAALLLLLIAGCAAQPGATPEGSTAAPSASTSVAGDRKIAYRAEVRLIVEHFQDIPSQVDALAARFDGFVAEARIYGAVRDRRQGSWTLRVPASRYGAFLGALGELGEVVSLHSSSQDLTTESVDLDARLRNARAEEQRLLAILDEATGKLTEILAVEKELVRVRGEIEQMQSRQRMLHDQVALSTITLVIDEIKEYFPDESATYLTRIRRSMEMSVNMLVTMLQDLSIALVAALPWLIAISVPVVLTVVFIRRWRRVPAEVVK